MALRCYTFCTDAKTHEMKEGMIGSTAKYITKRTMYSGEVSSDPSLNDFIQVGKAPSVAIKALEKVHGEGLCAAALCSTKPGTWRAQCCDMRGNTRHKKLLSRAHDLPAKSGPNHKRSWSKVLKITEKIRSKKKAEEEK